LFGGVSGSGAHRALNGNTAAVSQLQLRCEAIVFEGRRRRRLRKGHHAFPRIYLDSGGAIVGRVCLGEGAYTYLCDTGPDGIGPAMPVYSVRFDPQQLWEGNAEPNFTLYADLYAFYVKAPERQAEASDGIEIEL